MPQVLDMHDVEQMVQEQREESHSLEFKRKSVATEVSLNKDDRKLLGESLSGFANATGGTILLGIGTRKIDGVDRATTLEKISDVSAVAAHYRAYANECISPPLDGLSITAISDSDGQGVVLIEVPKGQARPHMSTAPGHQRYYRRVGDSFVPMQHYEVEEMMRAKTTPRLELIYRVASTGSIGGNRDIDILFGLRNSSRVSAKYPYISYLKDDFQPPIAQYGLDGNGGNLWPKQPIASSHHATFAAGADQVLHPQQELFVSKLEMVEWTQERPWRHWAIDQLPIGSCLKLRFSFGCEDSPLETVEIALNKDDLLAV